MCEDALRYLVQSQHVEVTDVVLLCVFDPRPALLLVDHLPDVLGHEVALTGTQGRAFSNT